MFPLNFFKKPERWASNFFQSFQLKFMASLDNRPFCDRTNTATAEPVLKKSSNRCHLGANRDATGLITTGRSCPWHRPTPCLLVQNKLNQVNVTEGLWAHPTCWLKSRPCDFLPVPTSASRSSHRSILSMG